MDVMIYGVHYYFIEIFYYLFGHVLKCVYLCRVIINIDWIKITHIIYMKKILGLRSYIDLALVVILVAGLVYSIGFGVSLYIARQEVTAEVNSKVQRDIEFVNTYVDGQLQRVEDVAFTLISSKFGASNRDANGEGMVLIDPSTFRLPTEEEVFLELERFLDINPHICGAAIGFENFVYPNTVGEYGFAAYVTNVSGVNERLYLGQIHDFHQKEWYKEAATLNKPYWSRPFAETRMGKVVTCYSLPLHGRGGRLVGVLAVDIDTDAFRQKCNEVSPFPGSEVTIVDREFRFVSHPDSSMIMKSVAELDKYTGYSSDDSIQEAMVAQTGGSFTVTTADHTESFFFISPIKRNGWTISIECPKEKVFGGVSRMKRDTTIIAVISILFMLIAMLWIFRRLQKLTISKTGIESELKVASSIQMGMIPKIYPAFPDIKELDVCGFLKPAKSVGGDLYDYCIRDNKLFFCIGDVSGKGIPASLFMTVIVALFRNVSLRIDDPADILSSLNDTISKGNEYSMFCTMFLGVLDLKTGELSYCNGGHNAPIIRRLKEDGSMDVKYMDVKRNIAVGLFDGFVFEKEETRLAQGEAIFLYTDGVTEAENANHELFGEEAALASLIEARSHDVRTAKGFVEYVYNCIAEHAHDAEQSDDITMLVVDFKGE